MKTAPTLLFTTCLLVWPFAAAAAPPILGGGGDGGPEEQACVGKSVSDPCTLPNGSAGACGEGTCSRLDYSQGSPPKAVEGACVVCKAGPSPGKPPTLDGADGHGSGATKSDGAAGEDKEPPASSSRCQLAARGDVSTLGLLLLGLGCVAGLGRRRRAPSSVA